MTEIAPVSVSACHLCAEAREALDALSTYMSAVGRAFGADIDYAMFVKIYEVVTSAGRYELAQELSDLSGKRPGTLSRTNTGRARRPRRGQRQAC